MLSYKVPSCKYATHFKPLSIENWSYFYQLMLDTLNMYCHHKLQNHGSMSMMSAMLWLIVFFQPSLWFYHFLSFYFLLVTTMRKYARKLCEISRVKLPYYRKSKPYIICNKCLKLFHNSLMTCLWIYSS